MKLSISDIKQNPNNPRLIKDDKFKSLVKSLKDFPEMVDVRPVVVNKDHVILGGNMRFKAAKDAGWKEIPVIVVDWSEEKQREFIIKDNVSGGDWDWELLANEWDQEELEEWGLDTQKEWKTEGVEEDEAPEVSSEPAVSQLGEVYQLGRHRVMCGDSTKIEDVERLMDGKKADMVFTDPPYNISYEGGSKKREMIENDKVEDFYQFLLDAYTSMFAFTKGGAAFYVCHADSERVNFTKAFRDAGGYLSSVIIWAKNNATFGRSDYFWRHEPILYGWNASGSHQWFGDRKQDTIWNIDRPSRSDEHPTMKPIELIARAIQNSSKTDDLVTDLFLGSGSTLIACEQTNRTCYGMELDPKYCDVIRKRYAKFIGKEEQW